MTVPIVCCGRRAALAACAAVGLLFASCGDDAAQGLQRPNFVLITIDTLRADHVGCYGYFRDTTPSIDALARESVVFDAAYAAMATTLPSHASMLTARYPLEHGILANIMHGGKPFGWKGGMVSFAQVARDAGYATAGFVSAAPLKAPSGIGSGFDTWSEPKSDQVERRAGETMEDVLPWLAKQGEQPFFLWVHFYDPHWPHRAPAPFDTQFDSDAPDAQLEQWIAARGIGDSAVRSNGNKTTATRDAINNYCAEVRYADSQVGVLLDALRKRGLYDESVVILTADHGEGLNQHDWSAHGLVWDEQLRVPLMMRFPTEANVAPRRVDRLVSLIDMFPTALGRVAPLSTSKERDFLALATGVDVLDPTYQERPLFGQRTGREIAESEDPGEMYAVTTKDWKFIHEPEVGDQLFDRRADPFELVNVIDKEPDAARKIGGLSESMRVQQAKRGAELGEAKAGEVDTALQAQLQKLGYAGGDDGRGEARQDERAGSESRPRKKSGVRKLIEQLGASEWEQRRDAALELGKLEAHGDAVLAALETATHDEREEVRVAAAATLAALRAAVK